MHLAARRTPLATFFIATAAAALYLLTAQARIFGDGIFFGEMIPAGHLLYFHLLFMPVVAGLHAVLEPVFGVTPEQSVQVLAALSGGVCVAATWLGARSVLGDARAAAAAAGLLALSTGHWFHATATELHAFHAAFATMLWVTLVRCVLSGDVRPAWIFVTTAGTLGSHSSGIAALLPIACTLVLVPRAARVRVAAPAAAAAALYAAVVVVVATTSDAFAKPVDIARVSVASVASRGVLHHAEILGQELLLFALPASILAVAGLRALFDRARRLALLATAWVIAWPLLAAPIADQAFGSYYTPVFPVLATLAIAGWNTLATSRTRTVAALLASLAPAPFFLLAERGLALVTWLVAAAVVFRSAATSRVGDRAPLALLPAAAALAVSAIVLAPHVRDDPLRARIRAVARVVGDDLVLVISEDNATLHYWRRFLPARLGDRLRLYDLGVLTYFPEAEARSTADRARAMIANLVQGGHSLWLVGDRNAPSLPAPVRELLAAIASAHRLEAPAGAPEHVWRVVPR